MFYSKEYDQYVRYGTDFTLGGVKYPATWLNETTLEQKEAIGLVEVVVVGSPADDRFYWVSTTLEDGVETYTNTPKNLIELQDVWKLQVKQQAYSQLFPSDWMVIRSLEGTPVPEAWTAYRASVRSTSEATVTAIENSTTVEELISVVTAIQWPNDPNYVEPIQPVEQTAEVVA